MVGMTMISFSSSRLKGGTVQRPAFQASLRSPPLTCGSKSERTVTMTRWMPASSSTTWRSRRRNACPFVGVVAPGDELLELVDQQDRLRRPGGAVRRQRLLQRRQRMEARTNHRQDAMPRLAQQRQQAGLDHRRLAGARRAAHHQQPDRVAARLQLANRAVAPVEQRPVGLVERLQPLVGTARRNRRQVQPMPRVQEDELALVVLAQGKESGRLTLALPRVERLRLDAVADVGVHLGGGDHAVAFASGAEVRVAGERVEQRERERRMRLAGGGLRRARGRPWHGPAARPAPSGRRRPR